MKRKLFIPGLALLCLALLVPGMFVMAQNGLDSSQEPNFGYISLESGFLPDPYIVPLISGGNIDTGSLNLGTTCGGNVTAQPDFVIEWGTDSQHLRIFFVGTGDTTLIVEQPNGSYICNDDSVGTDPAVDIQNPSAGNYAVWVGTYGRANNYIPGYLMITEFSDSGPGSVITNIPNFVTSYEDFGTAPDNQGEATQTPSNTNNNTNTNTGALNSGGNPTYSSSNLTSGFSPDPVEVSMTAGGDVDVTSLNVAPECRGFTATNPDYAINWSGSGSLLRVFFTSDGDTTLVVRTPSGQFVCNDDFRGLNPLVDIPNPTAGTYEVWVGTFGSNEFIPGSLYISGSTANDPGTVN